MPRIVIVGAGLSGLAVAFRLRRAVPDADLVLLESRSRPGGNVWTEPRDGFRVEFGPNGFLDSKPGTLRLCRDLGLGDQLITASEGARKNRFVYARGHVHKLPGSPLGLITTPLLSPAGKIALLSEPFRRRPTDAPPDESVAAFARRRFGREAADVFVDALVTGIHAGDPERLSVRAAFPRLAQFEEQYGSVVRGFFRAAKIRKQEATARGEVRTPQRMLSFRHGLRVLVETLSQHVGTPVVTGAAVRRIEPRGSQPGWTVRGEGQDAWDADAVVLTCPAHEQTAIVGDLDPAMAADLAGITFNTIAVVALGYRTSDVPGSFDGFGYIAPQNTKRDVLGVQWCSSIFPDRAPPGFVLWRVLCGGVSRPDVAALDDEALIRACNGEMRAVLGVTGDPVFRQIVRWPKAIPQYNIGHIDRVGRVEAAVARHPGLFVTGNSYHGVAMNDVTEQAELVAGRVAAYLKPA
ncbi:protoporphyrinogen oxidase [Fimbriiglobus ruber]|uniref:Coproporphyrinogen III oxidase n=1 Tax=Fimbriiglobus ruber TaxID=1908690 RepID=A0A225DR52_9BACT|nr:protoporphyrinogen oxidase [Fimbriiglobus ruber]OWK38617.1 Protoporphyrinogen IX oxidase, aerobic, HemY [Fimbriiglobus ruber]